MLSVDACGVELQDSTFRWMVGGEINCTVRGDIKNIKQGRLRYLKVVPNAS